MAKIEAPYTPEQVEKLKQWQTGVIIVSHTPDVGDPFKGMQPVHPFTCCSHNGCKRDEREDEGVLIPSTEGWVCPCGEWKQNWCHDFMVE
jgi:hypothetical protein